PAFYATVVEDWGSSLLLAQALGERAQCLVDLGHHLPNTNIELVVARLLGAGKLGGFHFNDSKYGDDDLTAGSIKPYGLFLIFHELVLAERVRRLNEQAAGMSRRRASRPWRRRRPAIWRSTSARRAAGRCSGRSSNCRRDGGSRSVRCTASASR